MIYLHVISYTIFNFFYMFHIWDDETKNGLNQDNHCLRIFLALKNGAIALPIIIINKTTKFENINIE